MSVNITVTGNRDTNEFKDAEDLEKILRKDLPDHINGKILIVSNVTLFGQDTKDVDLVMIGFLENYSLELNVAAKGRVSGKYITLDAHKRNVYIKSFCFVIETKRQEAENIKLEGNILKVKYKDKYHDVTNQSEKQKYALKNYLDNGINYSPYICNFIWFRSINHETIIKLTGINNKHNYLPNYYSFSHLMEHACAQNLPNKLNGGSLNDFYFSCMKEPNDVLIKMEKVFDLFEKNVQAIGNLTRSKIENITKKILDKQNYAKAIGKKLVIISGRAGTGKTIKLLKIASDLAIYKECRCLILTYNNALVSDIKRMLALAKIPDGLDTYTVNVETIHKFIRKLIVGFGIQSDAILRKDYFEKYDLYLNELYNCIEEGLVRTSDIQDLMKKYHDAVAWDYILIDESQDWNLKEKQILYKIFGHKRMIIADGIDQLVRSRIRCNWATELLENDIAKTYEKRCLRQKGNLVNFVNEYAKLSKIEWDLEAGRDIVGGRIVIINGDYDFAIHKREFDRCVENGNSAYEMLFLVPPTLVNKKNDNNEIQSRFALADKFRNNGIEIWDGTNKDLRTQYPVELNQHRLLQYDSCRGLEGWTVVCLDLDEFIKYKTETYEEECMESNMWETNEDKKNKYVSLWSLIPLTRGIDTLIITIKNQESDLYEKLYEIYNKNADFIEWIDNKKNVK